MSRQLRSLQKVGSAMAFGELATNISEQMQAGRGTARAMPETRDAYRCAQFKRKRSVRTRHLQGALEVRLCLLFRRRLQQQELAFQAQKFWKNPEFAVSIAALHSGVQRHRGLRQRTGLRERSAQLRQQRHITERKSIIT